MDGGVDVCVALLNDEGGEMKRLEVKRERSISMVREIERFKVEKEQSISRGSDRDPGRQTAALCEREKKRGRGGGRDVVCVS